MKALKWIVVAICIVGLASQFRTLLGALPAQEGLFIQPTLDT
jgi:hypothetical protein